MVVVIGKVSRHGVWQPRVDSGNHHHCTTTLDSFPRHLLHVSEKCRFSLIWFCNDMERVRFAFALLKQVVWEASLKTFARFGRRLKWFSLSNQWVHWIAVDMILISFLCLITSWSAINDNGKHEEAVLSKKKQENFLRQLFTGKFSFLSVAFVELIELFRTLYRSVFLLLIHLLCAFGRTCQLN